MLTGFEPLKTYKPPAIALRNAEDGSVIQRKLLSPLLLEGGKTQKS